MGREKKKWNQSPPGKEKRRKGGRLPVLSEEEINQKTREIEEALRGQRERQKVKEDEEIKMRNEQENAKNNTNENTGSKEETSGVPAAIPGMTFDPISKLYFKSSHLRFSGNTTMSISEDKYLLQDSCLRSSRYLSVVMGLTQRHMRGLFPSETCLSVLASSIQIRSQPCHSILPSTSPIQDLCYHPSYGVAAISVHHVFFPLVSASLLLECPHRSLFNNAIKWCSVSSPFPRIAVTMGSLEKTSHSFLRICSFDSPFPPRSSSLSPFDPTLSRIADVRFPEATEWTRALEWVKDDSELLVGCTSGLYLVNPELNRRDLMLRGPSVVSLDILDSERAISILGMRNGSIRLCDPREPNLNPNHIESESQSHISSRSRTKLTKSQPPLKNKPKLFAAPPPPPSPHPGFQCCIDHIKVLRDGRSALIKDIVGNISRLDVRKLSKVVMSVARSDPARGSRIDFSRFYVDDEESMLFTTSISPQHRDCGVIPVNSRSSAPSSSSAFASVVQVWSLRSELSMLREISFASPLAANQSNRSLSFGEKMNVTFASHCSSPSSVGMGSRVGEGQPNEINTSSLPFGKFDGSYFCAKTENNTSSIHCLHP